MPITHDSMRLIDQAKAICEQRIYLDEAKELYSLISSKWLHVSWTYSAISSYKKPCELQNVLEIHDELAAQIANSTEEVEYIDGVSSIDDDEDTKTITSEKKDDEKEEEEEEVQIDTYRVIGVRRQQGECLVKSSKVFFPLFWPASFGTRSFYYILPYTSSNTHSFHTM